MMALVHGQLELNIENVDELTFLIFLFLSMDS